MLHSVYVPNYGDFADASLLAELAQEAERHGWDGFMIYDIMEPAIGAGAVGSSEAYGVPTAGTPVVDAWITLAAIAGRTERLRLGALVTPLPRRRPTTLARQAAAIDRLSAGRLTLGVGTGVVQELAILGEETDTKTRAAMLDEALEVLQQLWSGKCVSHRGDHYQIRDATFLPTPAQSPRIPVWVGVDGPASGSQPFKRPLERAARWDGLVAIGTDPGFYDDGYVSVDQVTDMLRYVRQLRPCGTPFDFAFVSGNRNSPRPLDEVVSAYEGAGVTWWLSNLPHDIGGAFEFVRAGPPRGQSTRSPANSPMRAK